MLKNIAHIVKNVHNEWDVIPPVKLLLLRE